MDESRQTQKLISTVSRDRGPNETEFPRNMRQATNKLDTSNEDNMILNFINWKRFEKTQQHDYQ